MVNKQDKKRFINIDEVIHRTGLKKSTIYEQMKRGIFPKNINIAFNRTVWLESEIDRWIDDKIKNRKL